MRISSLLTLSLVLFTGGALAQTTRTWNGAVGGDWFTATNWTPAGVPAPNDTINFSTGAIDLSAPVSIAGQFNWTGGTLSGSPLTIAASGVLTVSGASTKYLQLALTNAGTVTWTGGALYVVNNGTPSYPGAIENISGGVFDVASDQILGNFYGGTAAYFRNSGTLRKSAGAATASFQVVSYNAGSVVGQQGILSFQNGGVIESNFTASAGATVQFNNGPFSYAVPPVITGPGTIQFSGGTLTLLSNVIPNLQLVGGSLTLSPAFQGGSITNLTCSSTLSGNYTVAGVLNLGGGITGGLSILGTGLVNWSGGNITAGTTLANGAVLNWTGGTANGPLTVASGATLKIGSAATKYLMDVLTNAGTVIWTNGLLYVGNNGTPSNTGAIENQPGALFDIACDQNVSSYYGGTNAYCRNLGTLRKSAATGTTTVGVPLYNAGSVLGQQGTLNFGNGGVIEGSFTASAGATIQFNGGAFSYAITPVITGPGTVQFTGGTLTLLNNIIPNLQLTGGALTLSPSFQGGSITNLTSNSALNGSYTVAGMLNLGGDVTGNLSLLGGAVMNWSGGVIAGAVNLANGAVVNWIGGTANGPLTVASGASLVLASSATKYLSDVLTNAGTVTWSNGLVYVMNNGTPTYAGAIENQPGGLFDIACDQNLTSYFGNTNAYLRNLGTVKKSAAAGTTYTSLRLYNSGLVQVQQGVLEFQAGGVIEGSFTASAGAAIHFDGGLLSYAVPPVITGPGAVQLTGGTLTLLDNTIPNLQLVGGTAILSPGFQGGSITNLNSGGTLSGNYIVAGTLTLGGGVNGSLSIQGSGVLNWTGGTITGGITVTSGSIVNWSGGTLGGGLNIVPGAVVNFNGGTAGAPITVANGASLLLGGTGTKNLSNVLTNSGTVTWTNGTIYVLNNGTPSNVGAIENQPSALFDIACDQSILNFFGNTNAYLRNLGTLQKSAADLTTSVSVRFFNAGSVVVHQGLLNFQSGGVIEGNFTADAGATIQFSSGPFSYAIAPVINGPGSIQLTGGTLTLLNNTIPNLQLVDGTVTLNPGFQGGVITNLNCGGTLNGNYTVAGTLNVGGGVTGSLSILSNAVVNWTGGNITGGITVTNGSALNWSGGSLLAPLNIVSGAIVNFNGGTLSAPMTIATNAALVLGGTGSKYLFNVLTNAGTVTWTNGMVYVGNNGTPSFAGAIENLAGALWDIRCDQSIGNYFGGAAPRFHNLGFVQKSAGTAATSISILFQNAGSLSFFSGSISFSTGNYAPTGAALNFGLAGTGAQAPLSVAGNLSLDGTLSATLSGGYVPAISNTIPVISCGTLNNSFNSVSLPPAGNNLGWRIAYAANGVSLQVVSNTGTTAQISGLVTDNALHPLTNIPVVAFTTNSSNSIFLSTTTDITGHYVLNVSNGVWRVGLQGLAARGYNDVPTQDVSVNNANQTANFTVQPYTGQSYTINVSANPPAGGGASGGGTFLPGSTVTLTATPNTNTRPYFFTGWSENGILQSSSNPYIFSAQRNRQLVANFTLPQFTVSVSNNPPAGGSVTGAGTYVYASTNLLTAQPNFGYHFGWWNEGATILGSNATLTTVIYSNRFFVANYFEANTNHIVTTATQPPGLAAITGAGVYTNGQSGTFTAPLLVTSGQSNYFFQKFTLTNTVVSTSNSFTKTFATVDPTNLQYVAVYASLGLTPAVTNVSVNFPNPVPATTNFQISFRFDRSMDTNFLAQVTVTNAAPGAIQPVVPPGGSWGSVARSNDTFYAPAITFSSGMDGTLQVDLSGARDPLGAILARTNVYTIVLDATAPILSSIGAAPSVLSAFVTWNTDEASDSLVEYGPTTAYGSSSGLFPALVQAHGITLNSLTALTTYHFRIHSRDHAGNEVISGDNNFTTFAAPDLLVTNVSVTGSLVSGGQLLISWVDTNSGSGATFTSWYDRVIVTNATTSQSLLNSTVYYDSGANGNLAAGGSRNRQLSFTLPNGPAGAGTLRVLVTANAFANQYEFNAGGTAQTNNTATLQVSSALAAYPDLQVTGLAITNAQIRSGSTVGVVWNEANTGTAGVSNSFTDRILVVNQTTAQTLVDTLVTENAAVTPIGPGQSPGRQFSFTLPDGNAGAGNLQIAVIADSGNNIFEYNGGGTAEVNNTNTVLAVSSVAPYPDLVVTNIIIPANANAGQTIPVRWTDRNQGTASATNAWFDQVFITDVNAIGGGQLIGTFSITNPLPLGQSLSVTQYITLPQFAQGNRWLVIKGNASSTFFELNTTNNSGISTQAVALTPTLLLSLSRTSVSEDAGTNSVLGTLTRNGDISGSLSVNLATATGTNLFVPLGVTIPAGQSAVTFLCGPIDHFIAGNPIAETITVTAAGFSPATSPLTILQDDPATLTLTLSATSVNENAGTNALQGTVRRNANFGTPLTVTLISDNPGNLIVPSSVTIPAGQPNATFGLTPVPLAGLNDTRRANVSARAPGFSPVSMEVLVLNTDTVQLSLNLLSATVNKGAGNSADVGTVSIPAPQQGAQNVQLTVQGSTLLSVPATVSIPAGATSVDFSIGVGNDNLATGPQTATIRAQALTLGWTPVTNGQASATLQILDVNGPTLSLRPANSTIAKGSNTLVTIIRNTLPTNSVTVGLTSSPTGILSVPLNVVLPLNQTSATFSVSGILDGVQTGPRAVTITATAAGFNSGAAPMTVSDIYLPDLVPTSVSVATNGLTSSQLNVSWVIANRGLGAATNQIWRDYIYWGGDSLGQNLLLAGLITNATGLPIGASYTNQASIFTPGVPGNYWLVVIADGGHVLTELNKQNNTLIWSQPITLNPVYRAELTNITPTLAPAGTPIVLSGRTYNPTNNQALPNKIATVRVTVNGARRSYTVVSDNNGNFSYTFQPLATEAGNYLAGADYPYLGADSIQGNFVLLGMQVQPTTLNQVLLPNVPTTGVLLLSNRSDHALTGLTFAVPDLQGNLDAQFTFTNNTLPGNGLIGVNYSLQSPLTHNAQIRFTATAISAEGVQVSIPVTANVVPLVPQLVANPAYLNSGMLVGQQTIVAFDIFNTGGASSGDLTLTLPANLTWLGLGSPATIPSIPAGGKATVTLLLNPPSDLPLTLYAGNLAAFNGGVGVSIPFQFRAVSTATGDLQVRATDDYTYYVAGAPVVTNATITLRDPFTSVLITQTNTDANGIAYFAALPAGAYTIDATASRHNQFRGSANVVPGTLVELEAFMPRQLVTYQWSVVPTEVPDNYRIVLQSVFETEVPVPNVVIEDPRVMLLVAPDAISQFKMKLTNHGLIAANGVTITVPDDPRYLITPLVTDVGIIPAQSSVEIPVTVQFRNPLAKDGCNLTDINACLPDLPLGVNYYYVCGPNNVLQQRSMDLSVICTAKRVKDCLDNLRGTLESYENAENLLKLSCDLLSALLACAGADLSPCQQAVVSTACGAAVGALEGGVLGAAGGGLSGGAGDIAQCLCSLLNNVSLPSFPTSTPTGGGGFGFGLNWGTGSGWVVAGGSVTTGGQVGQCSNPGFQPNGPTQTGLPRFLSQLRVPSNAKDASVCARVRIRIEQSVTLTRAAFRGTLEIDNGGDASLTGIQVALDFRDATNGVASSRFFVEGPTVSGMTAVDGSGTLGAGVSGSAVYTFVPTLDAAPYALATYQIGGTLSYVDHGELVTVPLLSAPITVYPEARLDLLYFQQRDVYADDPFTPQTEPSEPFYLGLIVKNVGAGSARNFQITSGQPQIVDNDKGLLINFSIIGTEVGGEPLTPSLSANLGDIPPGNSKEVTWAMLSTLQGKFISFDANFEHVSALGGTNTSLINSVEIHELIHPVLANRPGDDNAPDFLVNDIPDPASLPDVLYLSDGSRAAVNSTTNGIFDSQVSPGHLQIHLQVTAGSSWNYFRLPDPGAGYLLDQVMRSDGKILSLTNNAWTTSRSFPSSSTGAVYENLLHLFDYAGSGSYTIYYHSTNTTPPSIIAVGPVTPFNQSGALSSVPVVFSALIDTNTFSYTNLNLTRNAGANLITSGAGITLTWLSNATYSIGGLAPFTAADGNYQLTVNGLGIYDLWGNNAGPVSASTQWAKGNAAAVVQSISAIAPNPRNFPASSVTVTFSKAINPATFTSQALSLTRNGGPNLVTSALTLTPQSGAVFVIDGLGALTGAEGAYALSVNAAAVQDSLGAPGTGSQTVTWSMITTPPTIAALESVATNPRNIVVRTLDVTFSEPIDPASFNYHDVTLTRNSGPNLVTSDVIVTRLNPTTYQVGNISWVQGLEGNYLFSVNAAGVMDLAGNTGTGATNRSWQIILQVPSTPTNLVAVPDLGISATDGLTSTNRVTIFGTLGATNLQVRIGDVTAASDLGSAVVNGTNFTATLLFTTEGLHRLQFNAVDNAGNVSPPAYFNLFIDVIAPTVIIQQIPSPAYRPVTNLVVTFSEPVNTNTLSAGNFVATFNGGTPITPTLIYQSSNTFLLGNLGAYTAPLGNYQVTLQMNGIQDFAGNQSTNVITMSWVRSTTNLAPVIQPIAGIVVPPDNFVALRVRASDTNGDSLSYGLAAGAPPGASINPTTGFFFWNPTRAFAQTTNSFTVVVADNGSPSMSTTQSFSVVVLDYLEVSLGATNLQSGQSATLPVYIASNQGVTNVAFSVQVPQDLLTNWTLTPLAPQIGSSSLQNQTTSVLVTLNTAAGQSLQNTQLVARLNFVAASNHISSLITLPVLNISGRRPGGAFYSNYVAHAGTVALVQDQPFLLATLSNNVNRSLQLYGRLGNNYQVQYTTNFTLPAWQALLNYVQTNPVINLPLNATNPAIFYRVLQQ